MQAKFKKDNAKENVTNIKTDTFSRYISIAITTLYYTELLNQNEAKKESGANEMIHRVWILKNDSGVSYIYIANSKIVLVCKTEYVLRIFQKLSKNKKPQHIIFSKRCNAKILNFLKEFYMKINVSYNIHRRFYKKINSNNWPTICFLNNKNYINQVAKKVSNTINCMTIGRNDSSAARNKFSVCESYKLVNYNILNVYLNTRQNDNFSNNKKTKYFIIDTKKSVCFESFLKRNIKETFVYNMKYQCSEKNNFNITTNRFENITTRDCIEKKISRQTRQASHMRKIYSNRKRSIPYKTTKRKLNTKPTDKVGFCTETNICLNLNGEEKEKSTDNTDNCSKITSQVESSHVNTMSLFYEVVDTKNHRTTNYDIADNYLKQNIKQKPTLIVKFKKIRQSELSLLNGEAENFMFPKRFSYDNKQSPIKCERSPLKRSFSNAHETATECNKFNNFERNVRHSDYNSVYNNLRNTNNSNSDISSNLKKSDICFSFEKIPSDETWFNVFRRQDESKEKTFEYYGSTGFRRLPYEMGTLPSLQNCRTCTQQESERRDLKLKSQREEITMSAKQSGSKKSENDTKNFTQEMNENSNSGYKNFEMPRISPREHASTLAILSCLIKKSNNEVDLLSTNGQPTQNDNIYSNSQILNLIESVKSLRKKKNTSYKKHNKHVPVHVNKNNCSNNKPRNLDNNYVSMQKLTNELDYFLVTSYSENTEHLILNQNINHFSNDMNLLEITENQFRQESLNKALCSNKYKTKRKNNKTGWPKKKKIITRQQKTKATDNKTTKSSEFLKRMSPITPPYSDSEESMQCSYLNVLDDNFQNSYLNGTDAAVHAFNTAATKKPDDADDLCIKNIKYTVDKSNTSEKHIEYSLQPNIKFNCSPRKLRKLRGRYRER